MMDKPNIILINCDDLGYGDLGCYGSPCNRTPTLDHMAKNGIRMTDFYMASPLCSPSRGGMLTGCYPPRIGFGEFDGEWVLFPGQAVGLNPDELTIPQLLKQNGYRTKLIGKWHCGDQPEFLPTRHGFDEYYGLPYSNDMGRQTHQEDSPPLPLLSGETVMQQQPDQSSLTERYVEQATAFIHQNRETPFFLYFAHMHVHLPLYAPESFIKQSQNGVYGACVECIDWATHCVLHQLQQDGLTENTLVIFTSDNGSRGDNGSSNRPLRGTKAHTWEGGMRVPCIFYWPGTIPGGVTCKQLFSSIDFLPTFASLCQIPLPAGLVIDGVDGSAMLQDPTLESPRKSFFYYYKNDLEAVRQGRWKLHQRKRGESVQLLFDLEQDIAEQNNVYEQYPEVVASLEKQMDGCRLELGDAATGCVGSGTRPIGRVADPQPLTTYDKHHPYIIAMYDSEQRG